VAQHTLIGFREKHLRNSLRRFCVCVCVECREEKNLLNSRHTAPPVPPSPLENCAETKATLARIDEGAVTTALKNIKGKDINAIDFVKRVMTRSLHLASSFLYLASLFLYMRAGGACMRMYV
jgi:hypothetical protein